MRRSRLWRATMCVLMVLAVTGLAVFAQEGQQEAQQVGQPGGQQVGQHEGQQEAQQVGQPGGQQEAQPPAPPPGGQQPPGWGQGTPPQPPSNGFRPGTPGPGGMAPPPPPGGSTQVTGTAVYTLNSGSAARSSETLTASAGDQSAIIVSDGAQLKLAGMTIETSGNTSSMDSSSFYGLNAAILAQAGSGVSITDSTIITSGTGANAVFACGAGARIDMTNVDIVCEASGAHGVDATMEGTITMRDVNITTAGNGAAAAIATDRGGGTITASGGTVVTTGAKSPAIYSTGSITVSGAALRSTASEVAVIEGKNSITVDDCVMESKSNFGVFIYQSMSGDASPGTGTFTMTRGSLTAEQGPLFYSTNTDAVIKLSGAALSCKSGVLLKAGADQWGNAGANGSNVTLIADSQKLKGDVVLDAISTASVTLKNGSLLEGAVNLAGTAKSVSVALDSSSIWIVTADSRVSSLSDDDTSLANIRSNGHSIYYDKTQKANAWLDGRTISLQGGGYLTPM